MYAKFEDEVKWKLYEIRDNIKLTNENITIEHVIYLIEYAMDFEDFQIWLTKQYSLGKILSDNDIRIKTNRQKMVIFYNPDWRRWLGLKREFTTICIIIVFIMI